MSGIRLLLLATALFGFLPLTIVLYKRRRVKKILTTGVMAKARIYQIRSSAKHGDHVQYTFYNEQKKQYYGSLHCKRGAYNINDVIIIHYLRKDPRRNTLQGAWGSGVFIVFTAAIALFVLYAVYEIYKMAQQESI